MIALPTCLTSLLVAIDFIGAEMRERRDNSDRCLFVMIFSLESQRRGQSTRRSSFFCSYTPSNKATIIDNGGGMVETLLSSVFQSRGFQTPRLTIPGPVDTFPWTQYSKYY